MPVLVPPPLSLYIHFPWCVRKCPYCDFNSHELKGALEAGAYVDALLRDLEQELPAVWGRPVHSVFMGGGTPSLFPAAELKRLLSGVRALLPLTPDVEITLEANPGSREFDDLDAYRAAGINRLSFGVQSLNDDRLKILGRIHSAAQAIAAVQAARAAGFERMNLDLMFALPGQNALDALRELRELLALKPDHVSYYQLTLEANTLFAAKPPVGLPDDEARTDMYLRGREVLQAAGYAQYEVSAFAQGGQRCAHKVNYWQFGDYLGIGAGAHGKITDGHAQTIRRTMKHKHPHSYLARAAGPERVQQTQAIEAAARPFEFMLNHLRLNQPLPAARYESRTGLAFDALLEVLQPALRDGLLTRSADGLNLTDRGFLNSDRVLELLL